MSIKNRHIGFHAPLSLPTDALKYVAAMGPLQGHVTDPPEPHTKHKGTAAPSAASAVTHTIPGNDAATLAAIKAEAEAISPIAQRILQKEAELSALYNEFDTKAVKLWKITTEARDYAEKHDASDVHAITSELVYHAGRAARHHAQPTVDQPGSNSAVATTPSA